MMGHFNSFSASGVGNLEKKFSKIIPGGCREEWGWRECSSFNLTGT